MNIYVNNRKFTSRLKMHRGTLVIEVLLNNDDLLFFLDWGSERSFADIYFSNSFEIGVFKYSYIHSVFNFEESSNMQSYLHLNFSFICGLWEIPRHYLIPLGINLPEYYE
jgi:hypothetical protein